MCACTCTCGIHRRRSAAFTSFCSLRMLRSRPCTLSCWPDRLYPPRAQREVSMAPQPQTLDLPASCERVTWQAAKLMLFVHLLTSSKSLLSVVGFRLRGDPQEETTYWNSLYKPSGNVCFSSFISPDMSPYYIIFCIPLSWGEELDHVFHNYLIHSLS